MVTVPPAGHNWSDSTERWDWSPVYGHKEPVFVRRFCTESDLPAEFAVVLALGGAAGTLTQTGSGAYRYQDVRGGTHEFGFGGDARFIYRVQNADGSSVEFSL